MKNHQVCDVVGNQNEGFLSGVFSLLALQSCVQKNNRLRKTSDSALCSGPEKSLGI